jgi:putative MATE family efflux protein
MLTHTTLRTHHTQEMMDPASLATEPLKPLLFRLALPTVTAQLINMLYNIVDRIYIGHIPHQGSLALTGVGVCMPILMVISAFAALVGSGGAPRASILLGAGEKDDAENIMGQSFTVLLLLSAILTLILELWGKAILFAFGASENTIPYASSYLSVYAIGTVFVQLTLGMNAFIIAQGYTTTGMFSVLIGAISNCILDPVFIFALGMGVRGAAWATIISQAFSTIWIIHFLTGKKTELRLKRSFLPVRASVILPCLALGLSTFVMQATESALLICFNNSLLSYGGDIAVGSMTIISSTSMFMVLPLQGIGQGAQPIMSYSYGAGDTERVKKAFFLLLKVSFGWSAIFWILLQGFPQVFASIFTTDPTLLSFTKTTSRIYFGGMGLMGIQMACQMTFVSLGRAKESIIVASVRKLVLLIPLIYLMPILMPQNKTRAVFLAEPIADIAAITFTVILFATRFRKILAREHQIRNPRRTLRS